jgi:hypothetical protein
MNDEEQFNRYKQQVEAADKPSFLMVFAHQDNSGSTCRHTGNKEQRPENSRIPQRPRIEG